MIRKKVIFCDNLTDYDTLGNWDVQGDDATYTSNNDYLDTYKTNSDGAANYLDLTNTFDRKIYNFIVELDFKVIQQEDALPEYFFKIIDGTTDRGGVEVNLTFDDFVFNDEDDVQIGAKQTAYVDIWYRVKLVQSFFQQTSTTGKISGYIKDLSDPDNDWEYIGTNSSQSGGIDDIRIGHPDTDSETYQFQFKNLIVYELEEFP